ncbi:MAG: hypothetical protein GY927_25485 [bacterium]|nr:hypothetical protein [bacterium]
MEKLKTALDERGEREEVCILIDGHFEKHKKCPHCGKKHLQHWGMESGLRRWMCVDCKRTFNALTVYCQQVPYDKKIKGNKLSPGRCLFIARQSEAERYFKYT